MEDLIKKLSKDHQDGRAGRGRSYYKSSLVIVDEVGYTPISREECNLFFRFIAHRYEKTSTLITSNKAFSDWTELFHDPIIVTAMNALQNKKVCGSNLTTENGSILKDR
jgi:DNA replication protein DnaC